MWYAMIALMIVSVAFVVGLVCYCKGRWDERQDWNDILGLPERTSRYWTKSDIQFRELNRPQTRASRKVRRRWLNV